MRQSGVRVEPLYPKPIAVTHRYFHTYESLNYVERWEWLSDVMHRRDIFFERYRGRLGGVWKSEQDDPEGIWTLPVYALNQSGIDPAPWNNVLHLRNSKDATPTTVDEIYISPRIHFKKARMRATVNVPDVTTLPSGTDLWLGFEVTSAGGYAIASLQWVQNALWIIFHQMGRGGIKNADKTITQRFAGAWQDLFLEFNPPVFRVLQRERVASPSEYEDIAVIEDVPAYDYIQPFVANESSVVVSNFLLSFWGIVEIFDDAVTCRSQSWTNPTANPTLTADVGCRRTVTVWVQSITAAKTVLIQGSRDGTTFRDITEQTTALLNGINQKTYTFDNAYRFIKVTIEEFGTGTEIIEVTAA